MKEYKFSISTRYVGSNVEEIVEFDDDVTEEELHESWEQWVWEQINGGYSPVGED